MYVRFALDLASGNAAVVDDPPAEIARILRETADRLDDGRTKGVLLDLNGNDVGRWTLVIS